MRLLVVEDQKDLNEIIVRQLKTAGYAVDFCYDGNDARDYLSGAKYDGVILDIMLPGITGLGLLREIRGRGDRTPVLLLTALDTIDDKVAGLDAGADDYLTKPFEFKELLARVRAMVRRGGARAENITSVGSLVIDEAARRVTRDGEVIDLTSKEFDILALLIHNRGTVMTRDNLSTHIWNYDYDGASNVIDVYMHHLRKKIQGGTDEKLIETVKGVGYVIR